MVSGEFESFGCSVMGFFRGTRVIQSHCSSLVDKDINDQRRFEVGDGCHSSSRWQRIVHARSFRGDELRKCFSFR